ncbi:MAG: M14 family metallopeptidase [Prevotella sp.]|nr:M14 family metallopeptidase [Prevotella sp.]
MIKTIVSTALPVNERFAIRKNIIKNGKGNRRVCIVTGTHGDELEGQMVCYLVAKQLNEHPELLDGTVEIYPALNPLGIDTIQRGIPNFDLDMNRIFPGNPNGTMVEQAAHLIVEDLKGADLVFDIHSSNLYLRETPQVRINVLNEAELVPLAQHLNIDFVWVHDAATVLESTLAHSLNSTGTKCLVAELGVGQRINHKMCNRLTLGIFNLMKELGMWKGDVDQSLISDPIVCKGDKVEFLNAETSGIFITELKCGVVVAEGEEIGQIVEPMTGKILSRVVSPVEGYMFTIRAYPIVYEGSLMARVFKFHE